MSELLVPELDDDAVGAGSAEVVDWASVVASAGSSLVVGVDASLVVDSSLVVCAGSSELLEVGTGLGS